MLLGSSPGPLKNLASPEMLRTCCPSDNDHTAGTTSKFKEDMRFTDHIRKMLYQRGLRLGQKLTFQTRCGHKWKRVRGQFSYFSHTPDTGFRIHLTHVKWRGHYFGPMALVFKCRDIRWTVLDQPFLLMAGDAHIGYLPQKESNAS